MAKLASLTARKVIQALLRAGFVEDRLRGSHLVLIHPETKARTVVSIHSGSTIKEPLLRTSSGMPASPWMSSSLWCDPVSRQDALAIYDV